MPPAAWQRKISSGDMLYYSVPSDLGGQAICLPPDQRTDCGPEGGEAGCLARGCCYDDTIPSTPGHTVFWCSYNTTALDRRLYPSIGNGFLATIAKSSHVYIAGVYNLSPAGTYEP